jgi:hypothetical protein
MDQEITVTARPEGCLFSGIPVSGDQSLYNRPS